MGTITIVLSDDIEKRLREAVRRLYGSGKGGLSKIIGDALESYFATIERSATESGSSFKALKEGVLVAEANTLDELASVLRSKGVEPRGLRIISTRHVKPVARGGYRARPT